MKEEKVFIRCGKIELEALLGLQSSAEEGGVIFCHPHPQYGGTMHNPVIRTGVEAVLAEGLSTLRFNFRGVGESGGSYADGVGEKTDVEAAVNYLFSRIKAGPLALLGYSFGAWAGFPVALRDERIARIIGIAPPLEIYDFDFLNESGKDKLIMVGDRDSYCPLARLNEWFQRLQPPKTLRVIEGADHFFFFHDQMLAAPLAEFLKRA